MCNAIVCLPGCDVINFEIIFIFLIKPFSYMAKKSRQIFKYLENQNSFDKNKKKIEIKIVKRLSIAKNCHRPESVLLTLPPPNSL